MKKIAITFCLLLLVIASCKPKQVPIARVVVDCKPLMNNGYNLDFYTVETDTIKSGETFGVILDKKGVPYSKINEIVSKIKDSFDVRTLRKNKIYKILRSKDTASEAKIFIYKQSEIVSRIIDFSDSIPRTYVKRLPLKIVERQVSGSIISSFSKSLDTLGVRPAISYEIADIYASTLDFYSLQKGDRFSIVFEEKYIHDSIYVGYGKIKAMMFNHHNRDLYAFRFVTDTLKKTVGYYDENGGMLLSQFLKSPIKFRYRISSRYNLNRRIRLYGNKVRAHKGTDFAAPYGTPIMSTANGTVVASARRGGNGNYVKVRHDKKYSTQYLHMKRRKVRVGDYVRQGDIVGWVGMTGNTSGPHVCYRFWKNGVQVDPFKQKFPSAKPMNKSLIPGYLAFIKPLKDVIDEVSSKK